VSDKPYRDPGHRRSRFELEKYLDGERPEGELMHLPLFPLNVVLFPGMMLPLHIFEPRYREMINHCIETKSPFGVVLIQEGQEVGGLATPHAIGTAARIVNVKREADGRMNIMTVGTQRFKVEGFDRSHAYLSADVTAFPIANGHTQLAIELSQKLRPKLLEYVDLLSEATNAKMRLDRIPEDPKMLAYMVAIALQVDNAEKQRLLEQTSVPQLLNREQHLMSREVLLTRYMAETQGDLGAMSGGPTGYVFAN
jgi:Lon protease-like protein